jgi:hypothetical protein
MQAQHMLQAAFTRCVVGKMVSQKTGLLYVVTPCNPQQSHNYPC